LPRCEGELITVDWQAIGTAVALLGVIGSLWVAIRGQSQDRTIAENTASRAEAAARLTEEYTQRVVVSLEVLAERGLGAGSPQVPIVRWSLRRGTGDSYVLENQGSAPAHEVAVEGHPSLIGPDITAGDPSTIAPGEAIKFFAAMSIATSDTTVTVTWTAAPGDEPRQHWRYPLPV